VVKAWNAYKGKNFAILGVSLDKQKDAWLEAIKEDQLTWTHISDLQMWSSKAVEIFKFEGIPYNILIDPQGKVIAEELRGNDLEAKLKEVRHWVKMKLFISHCIVFIQPILSNNGNLKMIAGSKG